VYFTDTFVVKPVVIKYVQKNVETKNGAGGVQGMSMMCRRTLNK